MFPLKNLTRKGLLIYEYTLIVYDIWFVSCYNINVNLLPSLPIEISTRVLFYYKMIAQPVSDSGMDK